MTINYRVLLGLAVASALALAPTTDADESGVQQPINYARPFEPSTRPAFLPLPPGAVEPAGWLRDWCLAARHGFTGHMDEYDEEFKRAWAPDHKMTGDGLLWYKGAWPYEGGGYWFDGLSLAPSLSISGPSPRSWSGTLRILSATTRLTMSTRK